MPNYQEGKIYKIYNTINDDIYVGSTLQGLCKRTSGHRRSANEQRKQHLPLYKAFTEHCVENILLNLLKNALVMIKMSW